jgi:isocitrate dehydrogenase
VDAELKGIFTPIASELERQEQTIVAELNGVQGRPVDVGGYYHPDATMASQAMRPSLTFNAIIDTLSR